MSPVVQSQIHNSQIGNMGFIKFQENVELIKKVVSAVEDNEDRSRFDFLTDFLTISEI